jgi:hypothetical protein
MQHYAFQQMLQENKPLITSMCLYKYTDGGDGTTFKFGDMYNTKIISKTDDQKINDKFPFFYKPQGTYDKKNPDPNHEFAALASDGFSGANPKFFFISDESHPNTGLISIPLKSKDDPLVSYTDDSATLFKQNLGTNDYTSSYVTYAGTANAL